MTVDPDSLTARPPGAKVGRYEICRKLAVGGMATVYLARMLGPAGFRKLVALKCMHPHLVSQADFLERFYDEARLVSRISHPNVCSILDFGLDGGVYFIALELLLGQTLAQMRDSLEAEEDLGLCMTILVAACRGLHAAHELKDPDGSGLGVVHRDVSPDNVFVTFEGDVKVIDFGVAKAGDQLHMTRTRTVLGKFSYMAPEQLRGEPVDRRADIWSLGVLGWELMAGRRLFRRQTEAVTADAVLTAEVSAPSKITGDRRLEPLDSVVLSALSRAPASRYATAQALADDFEATGLAGVSRERIGAFMRSRFASAHAELMGYVRAAKVLGVASSAPVAGPQSGMTARLSAPSAVDAERSPSPWLHRAVVAVTLSLIAGVAIATIAVRSFLGPSTDDTPPARIKSSEEKAEGVEVGGPPAASREDVEGQQDAHAASMPTTVRETRAPSSASVSGRAQPKSAAPRTNRSARRRRLPQRTVNAGRGKLNVSTPGGWADVYVNGARQGRTPLRIDVASGQHTVELRLFGRSAARRTVRVKDGAVVRLVVPAD